MDVLVAFVVVLATFALLGFAALRWGVDTTGSVDPRIA